MAERLTYDDLDGHTGCRHHLEVDIKTAIRTFFMNPPANTSQPVIAQLRAALQAGAPAVTWTNQKVIRAIRAMVEDEAE